MYTSRDERGVAAVEFALIVPLLILFLFGIVEGGTRYTQQNQVNHWAYLDGARPVDRSDQVGDDSRHRAEGR